MKTLSKFTAEKKPRGYAAMLKDRYNRASWMISRFRDEVEGVAAIEFAFLAPLMLLMYVGTIEISGAVSANRKLSRVSSTIGDLLTQAQCYSDTTMSDIMNIADDIMYPYAQSLQIQVSGIQITGANATVQWSRGYGTTAAANGSPYTVPAKIMTDGNFLVAAKISMSYTPAIGWITFNSPTSLSKSNTALSMREELFLRPRIGNTVTIDNTNC
jgi:Flp pilus assembly protein TadG